MYRKENCPAAASASRAEFEIIICRLVKTIQTLQQLLIGNLVSGCQRPHVVRHHDDSVSAFFGAFNGNLAGMEIYMLFPERSSFVWAQSAGVDQPVIHAELNPLKRVSMLPVYVNDMKETSQIIIREDVRNK